MIQILALADHHQPCWFLGALSGKAEGLVMRDIKFETALARKISVGRILLPNVLMGCMDSPWRSGFLAVQIWCSIYCQLKMRYTLFSGDAEHEDEV